MDDHKSIKHEIPIFEATRDAETPKSPMYLITSISSRHAAGSPINSNSSFCWTNLRPRSTHPEYFLDAMQTSRI